MVDEAWVRLSRSTAAIPTSSRTTFDFNVKPRRSADPSRPELQHVTFGRTDGVQNVNRHLGEFVFQVFLGSRWWVTPAFGQFFNDRFAEHQVSSYACGGRWSSHHRCAQRHLGLPDWPRLSVLELPRSYDPTLGSLENSGTRQSRRTMCSSRSTPTGTSTSRVTSTSR